MGDQSSMRPGPNVLTRGHLKEGMGCFVVVTIEANAADDEKASKSTSLHKDVPFEQYVSG